MRSRGPQKILKGEPFSESLTDETIRMRRFVGIDFRGEDAARRPWVIGSGLDVWEIVHMVDDFGAIGTLAEETHLTEPQIRLALAYRDIYPDEIADAIAQNRRKAAEWHELYPFIQISPAA